MAKFFMECPSCKMPVLASTGLFAKKKIKCGDCGCLVMVEKMAEEPCPKCGCTIVYDRSKTSTPKCPSCSHVINVGARWSDRVFGAYTVNLAEMTRTETEEDTQNDCVGEETADIDVCNIDGIELEPVDLNDNNEGIEGIKE